MLGVKVERLYWYRAAKTQLASNLIGSVTEQMMKLEHIP